MAMFVLESPVLYRDPFFGLGYRPDRLFEDLGCPAVFNGRLCRYNIRRPISQNGEATTTQENGERKFDKCVSEQENIIKPKDDSDGIGNKNQETMQGGQKKATLNEKAHFHFVNKADIITKAIEQAYAMLDNDHPLILKNKPRRHHCRRPGHPSGPPKMTSDENEKKEMNQCVNSLEDKTNNVEETRQEASKNFNEIKEHDEGNGKVAQHELVTAEAQLQTPSSEGVFEVTLDVSEFSASELSVRVEEQEVVVEGRQERQGAEGSLWRQLLRKVPLPEQCLAEDVQCRLSAEGKLLITAPRRPHPAASIVPIQLL